MYSESTGITNTENEEREAEPALANVASLKHVNAQVATLQNLVQDYSREMMPQWIGFTTTTFCNLRCPHCQTHGTEEVHEIYNAKKWPSELVERVGKETLPYAYGFCLSLNGEPLATPYLKQRLREFREYGAKLHLTTNGTLLSKKTLARVLPIALDIHVSIDGATQRTCEAIRLGSNFEKLLYNIKLMTRVCELLPEGMSYPNVRLAFTAMASNVRDMPVMVRLARFLNVPAVDFYDLVVLFPHVRDEDLKLHKPLYNAYLERTREEADRLGIEVTMPDAFPGVAPDADMKIEGSDVILGQLSEDYYDHLPPFNTLVDLDAIESDASEVITLIEAERTPDKNASFELEGFLEISQPRMEESLAALLQRYESELEDIPGEQVPYCEALFKRTFVDSEGDVSPCCIPGRPNLGNVKESTIREIYNGKHYNDFRKQFFSEEPPNCCVGCRFFVRIPKKRMLDVIEPPQRVISRL